VALGVPVGWAMGPRALALKPISDIVLQLLKLMATPLIFLAVIHSLSTAAVNGRTAARLMYLLLTNTLAAILVGLLVANTVRPGRWAHFHAPSSTFVRRALDPVRDLRDMTPTN